MGEKEKTSRFWLHPVLKQFEEVDLLWMYIFNCLQDRNTLLCHSCEFMLTNVKKAENKL